jgi:hypothetical protein
VGTLSAEQITAWATVGLLALALVSAIIAFFSISSARDENRRWNTLNVCAQHEFSSTVSSAARRIEEAFVDRVPDAEESKRLRFDAYVILNYLDGIAIGVKQGPYIEKLAKDHLKSIVHLNVSRLLDTTFAEKVPLDKRDWYFLVEMAEKWNKNQPYFGGRPLLGFLAGIKRSS